jgi:hypothetical protein
VRRHLVLLLAAVLLLAVPACGQDHPAPRTAPATASQTPGALPSTLTLSRVGGIAGMDDVVVVRPDGSFTVTRTRGGSISSRLPPAQLRAIADAVQQAHLSQLPASTPGTVSDELYYDLRVDSRTYRIAGTQTPEQVRPLLAELSALLSSPAARP